MKSGHNNGIAFLTGIAILLSFQLIGELGVRYFNLALPGPVAGMALLLLTLVGYQHFQPGTPVALEQSATALLTHLSLLFIPAGVGVMVHFEQLLHEWLPIVVALVAGALITLATTALSMQLLIRLLRIDLDKTQDEAHGK